MLKNVALISMCSLAAISSLAAEPSPATATYLSLTGKVLAAGNAPDNDGRIYKIAAPVLHLMRAEAGKAKGTVLLFPGGGYAKLAITHEGTETAKFLNAAGFDVAILEYHVAAGSGTRELALADALAAFRLLKARHAEFSLSGSRIGVMGYSAGGHLAARTVQQLAANEQPDDLILIYPAYLHETAPAITPPVTPTARLFVLIAANDKAEWVRSSREYVDKWQAGKGIAEFHLLPDGGHGFGMKPDRPGAAKTWTNFLGKFLGK